MKRLLASVTLAATLAATLHAPVANANQNADLKLAATIVCVKHNALTAERAFDLELKRSSEARWLLLGDRAAKINLEFDAGRALSAWDTSDQDTIAAAEYILGKKCEQL